MRILERGVKEVTLEQPSLHGGSGLRHQLSAKHNGVLNLLPRELGHSSHLGEVTTHLKGGWICDTLIGGWPLSPLSLPLGVIDPPQGSTLVIPYHNQN